MASTAPFRNDAAARELLVEHLEAENKVLAAENEKLRGENQRLTIIARELAQDSVPVRRSAYLDAHLRRQHEENLETMARVRREMLQSKRTM